MHVDVDGGCRVPPGQPLEGRDRHEDGAAASPELFGYLDTHESQVEEPGDEVLPELRRLVHLVDVRTDIGLGKFADCVAKHGFFVGQDGERGCSAAEVLHAWAGSEGCRTRDVNRREYSPDL